MRKILFALILIFVLIIGMLIGTVFFSRRKVLGEQKLQDYIYDVTDKLIIKLEKQGFNVEQSHIVGDLWISCKKFTHFIMMGHILNVTMIYLHWKIDFLNQPVFYILANETAIIYEPF